MFPTLSELSILQQNSCPIGIGIGCGSVGRAVNSTTRGLRFESTHSNTEHVYAVEKNSGQSYKHFTIVNYDSRVVPDWKIPHITTLES